ncbi:C2H2 type zinc-finger-domain-containing protein [Pterulicium gracile]|uniref:C2H2 type zinc-finger-domain-containing protein n=1 Tax=Pterulicium gracile TaxID=1884261 RepID=A0A5C3QM45_9AGAR|nr:C2H2 type zinc-finger-domain-containing protein [Pterula gracilis]
MSEPLFTCLSCEIAFPSPEMQREHYRSDHHRYNMKRRVASLPPLSAEVFNQKVLDRREQTAAANPDTGATCTVCNKSYGSENAFRSHFNSKKHKENEQKAANKPDEDQVMAEAKKPAEQQPPTASTSAPPQPTIAEADEDRDEDEEMDDIDAKLAAARTGLSSKHCLFCTHQSEDLDHNLTHMSAAHSFFIPDADYLVDVTGLIQYLGEKLAIGNRCIYCNTKSKDFRSLHAVRKHMVDKSHCKIAYDSQRDRLELSDYYDFSSSYPTLRLPAAEGVVQDEDWEDVSDDEDAEAEDGVEDEGESSESDLEEDNQLTYGDSQFELVLPSGARIGHRSLKKYYAQSFRGHSEPQTDPNSGAALVRRLLEDKNSALIPRKGGGFGAFGNGTEVIKARTRGEAREAGRHVREFRDQKRREDHKTRMGFKNNSQKHFRDPLLQ